MEEYQFHKYANIFPLMEEQSKAFLDLTESLRQNGMLIPVVLYENRILDGRNRYRAHLSDSTIELKTEEFEGTEEEALRCALALNNQRRNLDEGQRALAALRLANVQSKMKTVEGQKWAADIFNVSFSTVRLAFDISRSEQKERQVLLDMIESDDLVISVAHNIMKNLPPIKWEQAALDTKKGKQWIKETKRQQREIEFANGTVAENRKAENKDTVYGVIYADPPWSFETYSEAGKGRSPDQHYKTMSLDDIRALGIPAADNCALFLWTTVAHLSNAIEVLEGWGFEYKSAYAWHKPVAGLGYWSRNTLELLLLGVKGEVPAPTPDLQMPQVIQAEQGEHSTKPEVFGQGIAKMFPHVPSVELFARRKAQRGSNWFYEGNEIDGRDIREDHAEKPVKKTNGKRTGKATRKAAKQEVDRDEHPINDGRESMDQDSTI